MFAEVGKGIKKRGDRVQTSKRGTQRDFTKVVISVHAWSHVYIYIKLYVDSVATVHNPRRNISHEWLYNAVVLHKVVFM